MKLGIALSGGGIRGIAHAGVLKALEDNNIKVDIIGGTSAGSMIASLYAMGYSPYYIYILFKTYAKDIIGANTNPIISGIQGYFMNRKKSITGLKNGEELEKIFNKMAEKRAEHKEQYITNVSIGKAVRASSSFPAVFSPCKDETHAFMDGGTLDNVPVNEVKKQGADKVIAVKFNSDPIKEDSNIMDIVMKTIDIMGSKISEESLEMSDLVLNVYTDKVGLLDVNKLESCYKYGYNCVLENLDKIREIYEK